MAKRSFTCFVEQELGKFPHFLIFAVLEWVLIILLFIDGFIAFVANEFAKFFELKVPCLLCTRIDHVLFNKDPDFYYNDSICEAHKKGISSLAYCHNHKKLSDIRKMCEGCLLSFATEKESDCITYKSLVGILHKDLECFVKDDLNLAIGKKDDIVQVEKIISSIHCCSCCGEPLKVNSSYSKGKGAGAYSLTPAPSPRTPLAALAKEETRNMDFKFVPDPDSLLEDDDGSTAFNPDTQSREEVKAATVALLTEAEDLIDEASKSPNFGRGNRFFGIPLSDSATNSPRLGNRITRKSPLGKTTFTAESIEENQPNEAVSANSVLHKLKRQVRLDRKSLIALYMELDEERSASAVAANNAMAMITRLQAEKAAVQMDALQYQRMMEEQAEYDQEALEEAIDLLAKREEEIKVLEDELEAYREKYGSTREDGFKRGEIEGDENYRDNSSQSYSSYNAKSESGSCNVNVNEGEINGEDAHNNSQPFSTQEANGGGIPSESLKHVKGKQRKTLLTRELSHLSKRVKALEADNGFLDQAAQTLEKHSEGTKLLIEISRNLRKLRQLVTMPLEENDA
ncbi:hypothetical protein I3843_11G034100 [Carya illinoinensis]|uniref:GTD-binding domain-containing protein n=1 Tax=Carya illinoinensis TaxID=32201 RepID=A0A8T1P1X2_CARIL|nr:probable myosin-binding protein 5 isoform X2 [Carya illinoinensis]KAG2679080.1 hypothetical protein I3760_11G034100 [Carya illinoinensis]KAG6635323.1 hypothetical protein CIPAW_11G034600 [Carya illinoinensis]KAG6686710.1 hypothetical protein I3842_11G034300 [Carya illinoinensis]KAG7954722.1 hypothetical protein I3843_11G034100 [Carya illinoinensis]